MPSPFLHDNYLTKFEKADVVIYDGQSTEKTAFSWKLTVGMPRYALIGGTRGYNQFRRVHEQIADYEYVELDVNDSAELERALKNPLQKELFFAESPMKNSIVEGIDRIELAKMIGMTPLIPTLIGIYVLCPPYILRPTTRFAY